MSILSKAQEEAFLNLSGKHFDGKSYQVKIRTEFPYNNREWQYSPWLFSWVIESESGYLICELVHRMTNNRIHGWDREGNELPAEISHRHFQPHI
ncbi:MAG: hypothetical protein AAF206_05970 [Bacteroidota bacterium]